MDEDALREALENCEDGHVSLKFKWKEDKKKLIGNFVKKLEDLPYRIYEMELHSGTKVMKLQVLYSDWFNLLKEYKEMLDEV